MDYRVLGLTGLRVSVLGFGCGNVGGLMIRGARAEQERAVTRAIELGINHFDTAPSYGDGQSETNLGTALGARRAHVSVGTKFQLDPGDNGQFPMLKEAPPRKGFFESDQLEAVCRFLPADLRAVARFAYITGWRIPSEVLTLTWAQVSFEGRGAVRLEPGVAKNDEGRTFPLTQDLRRVLEEQRAHTEALQRQTGRIIPSVKGWSSCHGGRGRRLARFLQPSARS